MIKTGDLDYSKEFFMIDTKTPVTAICAECGEKVFVPLINGSYVFDGFCDECSKEKEARDKALDKELEKDRL